MVAAARLTALAAIALVFAVAPASARNPAIQVALLPSHVLQGTDAQIGIAVRPAGVTCTISLRYSDGSLQSGLPAVVAAHGVASWSWTVPTTSQAGLARATFHCGRAGSLTRRFVVVGRLVAPRIVVEKTGFSTRAGLLGGTRLSYGVMLHNESDTKDASGISVQTNFVLANDHLLGTDNQHIDAMAAGADYALGNTVSFPGAAPVVRLEVVVTVDHFQAHTLHLPTLANIHLVPGLNDPAWLGTIEGEMQNTDPALTLRSATLSAVVFDANGDIVGGGNGYAFQSLPPGARSFLQVGNGLDVISIDRAATATVSISPSWAPPAG
jgi:hypothetical protein